MNKKDETDKIIQEHVLWALGAGFLPIPLVDVAAVTLVQMDMLKQICTVYEVDFSDSEGKTLLAALTGGTIARLGASAIKAIPGIGSLLGGVSMSIFAGATTYAIAQVAVLHFETGGTLFDFNLEKSKEIYKEKFEKGKEYASELRKKRKKAKKTQDDIFQKLEKLAEMKEKGIVTEEEFETQKQRLLERL
ncbi:MAG: DUF697 domain-containing protein [bacterium]|nr:DUF697 domain-containing protein [bacterium]